MNDKIKKMALISGVVLLIVLFFIFDLKQYLTLEYLKQQKDVFQKYYESHQFLMLSGYAAVYIAVTALSLPGAAILTLAGGALFGLVNGTIVVSFASTIGATCAFIASRYLLRDSVQGRFGEKLSKINEGLEKDGSFYLFSLRLVPLFPFFLINILMGLTPIKTLTFYWVSQLGMLPGTLVYVNAGTELAKIDSLKGVLSPNLLFAFVLLGIFPIIAKKSLQFFKFKK